MEINNTVNDNVNSSLVTPNRSCPAGLTIAIWVQLAAQMTVVSNAAYNKTYFRIVVQFCGFCTVRRGSKSRRSRWGKTCLRIGICPVDYNGVGGDVYRRSGRERFIGMSRVIRGVIGIVVYGHFG